MEADIRVYDTVDSTNTRLAALAGAGAAEGTCVVAFCQTSGQGRSGRTFYSPKGGNLYMSLLLRPKDDKVFDRITVFAAVATVKAIRAELGMACGIKWVNDVIKDGKKVCGIVAKAVDHGKPDGYVILGIGINIYRDDHIPEDIAGRYGSIYDRKCDLPEDEAEKEATKLAQRIISEFAYYYDGKRYDEAAEEYRDLSLVIGKGVEYVTGNSTLTARVLGIDDDGGIILETDDGVRTYRDGEIRIKVNDM